jgi:hypothetical protein
LIRANIERAKLEIPSFVAVTRWVEEHTLDRIQQFILAIDGLMENRIPVTAVISGGLEYKDMMITSHSSPRVSGSGGSIRVRMDLQQIITADPAETGKAAATRTDPAIKSTKAKGAKGAQRLTAKQQRILANRLAAGGQLELTPFFPVP